MEQQRLRITLWPGPPFPRPRVRYGDSFRELEVLHWLPLGVQVGTSCLYSAEAGY